MYPLTFRPKTHLQMHSNDPSRDKIKQIEADYLVIGAGAVSSAFADTPLSEINMLAAVPDQR